ncbi:unnamed protein product [Ilex paraguariensis]|uniref:Dihydroxy-acid/6-phosphogluconate dehydratase N-terminal domain-containing protein n=1 Tax=Ilex paraguariensis TaxID=185542 RepID=A0ABC8SFU2_9AQUA
MQASLISPTTNPALKSLFPSCGSHSSKPHTFYLRASTETAPPPPQTVSTTTTIDPSQKLNKYSSRITEPKSQGGSQAILYGVGLSDDDMNKPQIGISSVWYEGNTCNMHLLGLAEAVKEGVREAGMVGFRFNTIGVSDAISMGTRGMCFSLQSRDLIADSIETVMAAQWYDGNISIPGCDKNAFQVQDEEIEHAQFTYVLIPFILYCDSSSPFWSFSRIFEAELNITTFADAWYDYGNGAAEPAEYHDLWWNYQGLVPVTLVVGFTILPGHFQGHTYDIISAFQPGHFQGHTYDIISAFQVYGEYVSGSISDEQRMSVVRKACPGAGACGGMYTANTMASAIEAMGMSLPYSSSTPAVDSLKLDECRIAGKYLLDLIKMDLKPRDIITPKSLRNAMVIVMALGGSTNAVLHLIAIAR